MNSEIMGELYNQSYSMTDESSIDYTLNSIGWNSSFTGEPYTGEEMSEWRNETTDIINELKPLRVLEAACGTGMMYFRIIDRLEQYLGLDVASEGINYMKKHLTPEQENKTELYVMSVEKVDELEQGDFDVAFINSATQYMGGEEEFAECIKKLTDKIGYGGKLFLGDMKSASLRDTFYRTVEMWNGKKEDLEVKINKRKKMDFEFYISTDYLRSLTEKIPRIKHIDFLLKKGKCRTEMNIFRFNAIFWLDEYEPVKYVGKDCSAMDMSSIEEYLSSCNDDAVKLSGISNKLLVDIKAEKLGMDISAVNSCYISDVCKAAEKYGYTVKAAPHESDLSDEFDILARRR